MASDGSSGNVARLAAIAREFHERQHLSTAHDVAWLVHEEAEMSLVPGDDHVLRGRARIIDWLLEERQAFVYTGEVEHYELLDQTTLLLSGRARFVVQHGFADSTVFWVDVFLDELLWRVRTFPSAAEARDAYDTGKVAARSSG